MVKNVLIGKGAFNRNDTVYFALARKRHG